MPSSITHAYIGLDTLDKLNKKPQAIIKKHINNYKVYCQNMDVLYFYHIMLLKENPIKELGHTFHTKNVYKSFEFLINENKANKNEELFTFIAGLITHYQADSVIHPYINYLSKNPNNLEEINKHFEIETYIDNYYINRKEEKNYTSFNYSHFLFNYSKEKIIEDEITKLFKNIFCYDNMGKKYYDALYEMKFVFKYIRHDTFGIKKKIYQLIDLILPNVRKTKYLSYHFNLDNSNYYLNLNHKKWTFNGQTLTKSFLDLYYEVTKKSSLIINELYHYIFEDKEIDLYSIIGNNSYSNGLPLK